MSNLDILRPAAEGGNIDLLYTLLKDNPSVLKDIDSEQLIETPLHIAASKGHIPFAIEIMNWKPSFALKLNPEGLSPIHLAIQLQNKRMVMWFVDINADLVRVKGKEGCTPLHLASQIGDVDILTLLICACPDSLQDVTVWGDTALHIAAKNNNFDALHLLVSFLRKNTRDNADLLEKMVLNWKDGDDNTILHISAQNNIPKKTIRLLLINSQIYRNAKNLSDKTALDMARSEEIRKFLSRCRVKPGSQVINSRTQAERIKSKITCLGVISIGLNRIRSTISDQLLNTILVVSTLIITATYQSVLSPPGGLHQSDAFDNNANINSSNSNISTLGGSAGKSVMSKSVFFGFSYLNMISFSVPMILILLLTPVVIQSPLLALSLYSFAISYLYSMWLISPHSNHVSVIIFSFTVAFLMLVFTIMSLCERARRFINKKKVNVTR